MTSFPLRQYTKESQLYNKPVKLSQKQKGEISPKVRKKVNARIKFAPIGCCERCQKNHTAYWTLEQAHIDSRVRIGHKTTEYDLARLCGPSTQSGTCHHWVESTKEGREWLKEFQSKLG